MTSISKVFLAIGLMTTCLGNVHGQYIAGNSVYTQKVDDQQAIYFAPDNINTTADSKTDISNKLQAAINQCYSIV